MLCRKEYVDGYSYDKSTADSRYVNVAGDTMTGSLDMGAYEVSTTTNPSTNDMLCRKEYVDGYSYDKSTADSRYVNITGETDMLDLRSAPEEKIRLSYAGSELSIYCHYLGSSGADTLINCNTETKLMLQGSTKFKITSSTNLSYLPLSMSTNKITNVTDPTDAQDVATKYYVDNLTSGHVDEVTDPRGETVITTGSWDMNDFKTESGIWIWNRDNSYISNLPAGWTSFEFTLQVFYSTSIRVHQILYNINDEEIWFRSYITTWQDWERVCNYDEMVGAINSHSHAVFYGLEIDGDLSIPAHKILFYDTTGTSADCYISGNVSSFNFNNAVEMRWKIAEVQKLYLSGSLFTTDVDVNLGNHKIDDCTEVQFQNANAVKLLFYDNSSPSANDVKIGMESSTLYHNVPSGTVHRFRIGMTDKMTIWNTGANFDVPLSLNSNKLTSVATGTNTSDGVNKGQMDSAISAAPFYNGSDDLTITGVDNSHYTSSTNGIHIYSYSTPQPGIDMVCSVSGNSWMRFRNPTTSRQAGIEFNEGANKFMIQNNSGTRIEITTAEIDMKLPVDMENNRIYRVGVGVSSTDAVQKTYVDSADSLKLNLSGGLMTGAIDFRNTASGPRIYLEYAGSESDTYRPHIASTGADFVCNSYRYYWKILNSTKMSLETTLSMSVPIDMNSNKITELSNGTASTDAVNFGQIVPHSRISGGGNCNDYRQTTVIDVWHGGSSWSNCPSGTSGWWEFTLENYFISGTSYGTQIYHCPGAQTSHKRYYKAGTWYSWTAF